VDAAPRAGHEKGDSGSSSDGSGSSAPAGTDAHEAVSTPTPAGSGSSIHSDNGFGSSAIVPGVRSDSGGKEGRDRRGRGRNSRSAGAQSKSETLIQPAATSSPALPSLSRALLLLALGAVVALVLGLAAWRVSRAR